MREKSHSKVSNFKLTVILTVGAFAISLFWLGLILLNFLDELSLLLLVPGYFGTIISLILLKKFLR